LPASPKKRKEKEKTLGGKSSGVLALNLFFVLSLSINLGKVTLFLSAFCSFFIDQPRKSNSIFICFCSFFIDQP